MGQLETEARRTRRRGQIQRAILASLAVGGIVAFAAVAGNAVQLLDWVPDKRRFNAYAKTAAGRLVARGLAQWVEREEGGWYLRITPAGERALAFEQERLRLKGLKRRWDRRWRMVAFDLPERRRKVRQQLRAVMSDIGFVRLQDSVWVYPHDCEEFIVLLKAELKIGRDALYAIVEKLENDKALREHFDLPGI